MLGRLNRFGKRCAALCALLILSVSSVRGAIDNARYYFDDPLNGLTELTVSTANSVNVSQVVAVPNTLSEGLHTLYLQFRDDSLGWGPARGRSFLIAGTAAAEKSIEAAEYFVNTDAGEGLGTSMSLVTDAQGNSRATASFSEALGEGLHRVFVRFRDSEGHWGPARSFTYLVENDPAADPSITKAEYFIGDDPGPGLGTEISVSGTELKTASASVTVPESPGLHQIALRFYSPERGWGPALKRYFLVEQGQTAAGEISKAEYFFGADPGPGQGSELSVSYSSGTATVSSEITAPDNLGLQDLNIRFFSTTEGWGPARSVNVLVSSEAGEGLYISAAEFFIDVDPGVSLAQPVAAPLDGVFDEAEEEYSFDAELASLGLEEGYHVLYLRQKGSDGRWAAARGTPFLVSADAQPSIAAAEYFFNVDPGEGNGFELPSADGAYNALEESGRVELAIPSTGLAVGAHKAYVRFRNSRGEWGAAKSANFSIVVKPTIVVSEDTLSFGTLLVNTSKERKITVKNSGDADLSVSGISLPAGYSHDLDQELTVSPGDSADLTVTFTLTEERSYNGSMVISSNDVNKSVALFGSGTVKPVPLIVMEPESPHDFGEVDIFTDVSRSVEVTLRNEGTARLWISSISSSDPAVLSHNFSGLSDSLNVGSEIRFDLNFSPADTVDYAEYLSIHNNSPEASFIYETRGRGVGTFAPHISADRDSLQFGTVQTGTVSSLDLRLRNTGTIDLKLSSVLSSGSDFSAGLNSQNNLIPPQQERILQVNFSPQDASAYQDTLFIYSNDTPNSPYAVLLTGIGSSSPVPDIRVSPMVLDFGNIDLEDAPKSLSLSVYNPGSSTLNIQDLVFDEQAFRSLSPSSQQISPGSTVQLQIAFDPPANAVYSGSLKIRSNDPDIPELKVALTGSSIFPEIFVLNSNLNFGQVAVTTSSDLTVGIENTGTDTLHIEGFKFSPGLDSCVSILPSDWALLPSATKNFKVTFRPKEPVEYSGFIEILNNAAPDTVFIFGQGYDATPPSITFNSAAFADSVFFKGSDIRIQAEISDNNAVSYARLFWRVGGKAVYDSTDMEVNGSVYAAEIPSAYVTERGLDYYLEAFDGINIQRIPETAPGRPAVIRVTLPFLPAIRTEVADYQMFSIPSELSNNNAQELLARMIGEYNPEIYRLFRWENGSYIELSENPNYTFAPGLAYWLITAEAEVINIDTARSVSSSGNYIMSLYEGWNQVGTPFYFPISWQDVVSESPNVIQGGTAWEYSEEGWIQALKMEPFKGYFINTPSGGNILRIPPREYSESAAKGLAGPSAADGEWMMRIQARSAEHHDLDNYLGLLQGAEEGWDMRDYSAPSPMTDRFVRVDFANLAWEEKKGLYSGDFKPLVHDGQYWDIQLEASNSSGPLQVDMESIGELPPSFRIWLIDLGSSRVSEHTGDIHLEFPFSYSFEKSYRLVAGTEDFFEENNLGIGLTPEEFVLNQNFPNPFNSRTTIEFALPEQSTVTVIVFNSMGQQIRTLISGAAMDAGYHQIYWNGENNYGERSATGIYFYQMMAGDFSMIKKMLLLK